MCSFSQKCFRNSFGTPLFLHTQTANQTTLSISQSNHHAKITIYSHKNRTRLHQQMKNDVMTTSLIENDA